MPRRHETLSGIGERFADTDNAGVIRRDQTVTAGEVRGSAKPRAGRCCQSCCDKRPACERFTHRGFPSCGMCPVIIARTFLQNPARTSMLMCTIAKSISNMTKTK